MVRREVSVIVVLVAALGSCTAPNPAYVEPGAGVDGPAVEEPVEATAPGLPAQPDAAAARGPDVPPPPADAALSPDLRLSPDAALPLDVSPDLAPDQLPDAPPPADASPPIPGLVAYWRLDRAGGSGIADDLGRNSGTLLAGAGWTDLGFPSPRFTNRGSLQLDGGGQAGRLGTATLPALESAKTISLWFWINAPATTTRQAILVLSNPVRGRSIQIGLESGKIAVWTWNRAIGSGLLYAAAPAGAGWHHVGYTFDGSRHTLYLLGNSADDTPGTPDPAPVTEALLGAFDASNPMERFIGRVDDVRIYDRALAPSMMAELAAGAP